jgi:hypothetical protein
VVTWEGAVRLKLSLLVEMLDRASALGWTSPESALGEALESGCGFLERFEPALARPEDGPDPIVARAGSDVLRHRALALAEQNGRLADEVEALATDSLALHDRLWQAHERSSRLKVVLGRRTVVTVRPDPPLTIGGSGRRRPDHADRLLASQTRQEAELTVGDEVVARATSLALRAIWYDDRFDDALLVVLAHGLAVLETERAQGNGTDNAKPPPLDSLARRVFDLRESIRILQIRENAFRIDNGGMRRRLAQLEQEIESLEAEVAERGDQPDPKGGFKRRLIGRLLRRPRGGQ